MIGKTLSHYRVVEKLGAGGMGEVYRAEDANLSRQVAIKVLPGEFAHDAERLARFEREAKLLASLNHPNVASIYGLEEHEGKRFLVLELVEGQTLAERLKKGPIPLDETLDICRQIAEGLEAAHEKGIIHRDLKPANIKITPEGTVKVLDFGLAKALVEDASASNLNASPTISEMATRGGVVLGTAAYMSPEQARGKPLDRRTDIWSFGCLVYEMLTGGMAFHGDTISDTLVRILEREPDWQALPAHTPANLRILLVRCLRKNVRERLRDIGDVRIELADLTTNGVIATTTSATIAPPRSIWRHPLPIGLFILTVALAGLVAWLARHPQANTGGPATVSRLSVSLPAGRQLFADREAITISPDGREFVFVVQEERGRPGPVDDVTLLYRRSIEEGIARPIAGTEFADYAVFSPDGAWVGFVDTRNLKLKKVSLAGGAPLDISAAGLGTLQNFSWVNEDAILCATQSAILRVPTEGGAAETLVSRTEMNLEKGEFYIESPSVIPGTTHVLFAVASFDPAQSSIWIRANGTPKRLPVRGVGPRYLPTGHLLFFKPAQGKEQWYDLYAAPFDPSRLEVTGKAVLVLEGIRYRQMAISKNGTLVYNGSHDVGVTTQLVSADRQGTIEPLAEKWLDATNQIGPRVSPDGTQVLVWGGPSASEARVRIFDLRAHSTRILSSVASAWAAWTPDGKRVVFNHQASDGKSNWNLYWKSADGTGAEERLTTSDRLQQPLFVTRDGLLVYQQEAVGTTGHDLWMLQLQGDRTPRPLRQTKANEYLAALSPNGRYLAFVSDESGREEVWLCPFPACEGATQVSTDGGTGPVWSPDGQILYYRDSPGNHLFAAPVTWGTAPAFGTPSVTSGWWIYDVPYGRTYDVMPDGKHLVMIAVSGTAGSEITVVLNWFEELKRKMQGK